MRKPALEQGTCNYWPQGNVSKTACGSDKKRAGMVGKEKIKLEGEAGEPLEGQPLSWRDEGRQIWREYLYMMGALAPLREQWVALATETPDTCFCPLHFC